MFFIVGSREVGFLWGLFGLRKVYCLEMYVKVENALSVCIETLKFLFFVFFSLVDSCADMVV